MIKVRMMRGIWIIFRVIEMRNINDKSEYKKNDVNDED